MRLAAVRIPAVLASLTASFTAGWIPKSSAVTIRNFPLFTSGYAAAAAAVTPAPHPTPGSSGLRAVAVASDDPTIITIQHWRRLLDGELYAASSRVEWALLLRRTYGVDALRCPTCSGRMRVMATLTEPDTVKKILAHLGLPTEPLPRARARDPTGQESFDFDAA